MNDFKDAYRSAVQNIEEFHIDISVCMDKQRHKQRIIKHARRTMTTAFSAMCVIFVCGLGTVKGAEYFQNIIMVNERGFESGDAVTMARHGQKIGEAKGERCYVLDEELKVQVKEQPSLLVTEENKENEQASLASMTEDAEQALVTDRSAATENIKQKQAAVYNYSSWEEFEEKEDIIFPQPTVSIGQNMKSTEVSVCGSWAMVRYEVDDKVLWIERTNYADTEGHVSSKVFPGGISNERTYTTPDQHKYMLVDSAGQADSDDQQIHAAVAVGNYEVFIDFLGFTEKEAKEIMDSIDLSLYE